MRPAPLTKAGTDDRFCRIRLRRPHHPDDQMQSKFWQSSRLPVSRPHNTRALVKGARFKGARFEAQDSRAQARISLTVVSIDARFSSVRQNSASSDVADAGSLATVPFHN
jgi:hypothetical protein